MEKQESAYIVSGNGVLVDYPVGQLLTINGEQCTVEVAEEGETVASCWGCAINPHTKPVRCANLACGMYERKDGKSVYFKKI